MSRSPGSVTYYPSPIYIITYRRDRVLTYENLPERLKGRVQLVTDREDGARLRSRYPGALTLLCPVQGKGIGEVRQWVLETAYKNPQFKVCVMLDDDLQFQHGVWKPNAFDTGERKMFVKASPDDIATAFARLEEKAQEDGVGFTTCCTPFFNRFKEQWLMKRMAHSFWINTESAKEAGATFLGTRVMVDIKFSLDMYTAGFPSWSLMNFAARDTAPLASGGVNALGNRGAKHEEAARWLSAKWPRYVVVTENGAAKHLKNIGTKVDIRFYAVRAYKDNAHKRSTK